MNSPQISYRLEPPETLARRRVSDVSRFKDDVWELDRTNKAKTRANRSINWNAGFGPHGKLTDPAYSTLLHSCKLLIYALRNGNAISGHIKGSSLVSLGRNIISFVRWMVFQGYHQFSDLTSEDILRYRTVVLNNPGRYSSKTGAMIRHKDARPLHPRTVAIRMQPIKYLVELKHLVGDAPDWDPWREPGDEIGSARSRNHIPRIPDEIVVPLYMTALDFVTKYADPLIRLKDASDSAYQKIGAKYANRDYKFKGARMALKHSKLVVKTSTATFSIRELDMFQFRKLLQYVETACYIVIAGFTGLRISEMSGLDTGCLSSRSISGKKTLFIKSRLIKTAPAEAETTYWVAGVDEVENPVRMAVQVMTRIIAREREQCGKSNLFLAKPHNGKRAHSEDLTNAAINWRLNEFMHIVGAPYPWKLSTHQFRKSFARFVATVESCAIFALKKHFKHVSIQMTDLYIGGDNELYATVLEAQEEYACELLDIVLGSTTLAGKLGAEICAKNQQFRGIAGSDIRKDYIRSLLENTDVTLQPNAYGLCVFRVDRAACGGDRSRVGVNTCQSCRNNIVGAPHLPWWEKRIKSLEDYMSSMPAIWLTQDRKADIVSQIDEAKRIVKTISRKTK